jgi:hypothetical protein
VQIDRTISVSFVTARKILTFSAAVEIGTGVALIIAPVIVISLLLGADDSGAWTPIGRFFGTALLALGLACWPELQRADRAVPALRGMLAYNAIVAIYLAYLGTVGQRHGLLLWPGVALHAIVALSLTLSWRNK